MTPDPGVWAQPNSELLAEQELNNNCVFYVLQGVIKMVRTGCRGAPVPLFQREPLCQASKCDLTSLTNHAYIYANIR